jgi:hypothetical protein
MSMPTIAPRRTTTAGNPRGRLLLVAFIAALLIFEIWRLLFGHENKYEKLAYNVTLALQNNNLAEVKKYQNAETATLINRGIVGRAADRLAPLGKLKSVKEATPPGSPERVHEFEVAFDKGKVHEKIKVDPDFKIVRFEYKVHQ